MPKSSETPRDLRKKLSRSTDSRNSLKDKHRESQYEVKNLKSCLAAMTTSRDKWRLECKENKVHVKDLEQELSSITQNRDDLIAKLNDQSLVPKKKRKN
jgi:chromosome segregation ATPase